MEEWRRLVWIMKTGGIRQTVRMFPDRKTRRNTLGNLKEEINRRRTFAIISHPDAGKTTLTEKFLLYGGAINLAGSVKGKATARHAVSDWMEIEKQRGISVTSSVLQFEYDGFCINILDTPGHQDFSEDTYRTLMAADSAVMVIDASKGVEAQTRKLFKVCVMRKIPIFTFINKMDRDANDTFDLLDDIEKELGIATCPMNWPIGSGKSFKGVYDREKRCVITYSDTEKGTKEGEATEIPLSELDKLTGFVGENLKEKLLEEIELLDGASAEFDLEQVQAGELTPVFFGSALTNFGVEDFLQHFLQMTTTPLPRRADIGLIDPVEHDFSAFVFKIQANMNKAHRDRTFQCESVHRSDHKYVLPESGDRFRLPAPDSTHGPILPHQQIVRRISKPLHWRCSVEWKGVPPALSDGHNSSPPHRLQSQQKFPLPWLHRQWYASKEYLYHR